MHRALAAFQANSSKSGTADQAIAESFDALTRREPAKIDWIRYQCAMKVTVRLD